MAVWHMSSFLFTGLIISVLLLSVSDVSSRALVPTDRVNGLGREDLQ